MTVYDKRGILISKKRLATQQMMLSQLPVHLGEKIKLDSVHATQKVNSKRNKVEMKILKGRLIT